MKEAIKAHWEWKKFSDFKDPATLYQVLALRSEVFVVEQACVYLDLDGKDTDALHLVAYDTEQGCLMAYARVFISQDLKTMSSIGRVVVDSNYRGRGLATALMKEAIQYIHDRAPRAQKISVSAQHQLISFYKKLGFLSVGDPYDEDGILHIQMIL